MNDFIIVSAENGKELSLAVKKKVDEGYSLYREVEVKIKTDGSRYYSQSLIKRA